MTAIFGTGSLPTNVDLPDLGPFLDDPNHIDVHDQMRDEIVAIAAKSGVQPWGTFPTVQARLDAIDQRTSESITPSTPYELGVFYVSKLNNIVSMVMQINRPSSITVNGPGTLGTVPVGYRPTLGFVPATGTYYTSPQASAEARPVQIDIGLDGLVRYRTRMVDVNTIICVATWTM